MRCSHNYIKLIARIRRVVAARLHFQFQENVQILIGLFDHTHSKWFHIFAADYLALDLLSVRYEMGFVRGM